LNPVIEKANRKENNKEEKSSLFLFLVFINLSLSYKLYKIVFVRLLMADIELQFRPQTTENCPGLDNFLRAFAESIPDEYNPGFKDKRILVLCESDGYLGQVHFLDGLKKEGITHLITLSGVYYKWLTGDDMVGNVVAMKTFFHELCHVYYNHKPTYSHEEHNKYEEEAEKLFDEMFKIMYKGLDD
jgi:hypothetical protein